MELGVADNGAAVINDSYNANPDSVRAALATLGPIGFSRKQQHPDARVIAVLGDMLELGEETAERHRQMGVWAAERFQPARTGSIFQPARWGMNEWITLTYVMGAVFVGGQMYEYAGLVSEGLTISSSPYGSVFYLTTGFHALHVIGGLLAFLFLLGRSFSAKRFGHHEATTAIVTSYYWHFVDVVWIALFAVIYLLR